MPTPAQASEVGPLYDLLLATRDGSSLAVKDRDGHSVNVSQCAFMCLPAPNRTVTEETELDHKTNLVRLSSANLIDREFERWPQASQGDWTGGELQRVFSETHRYWQGRGLPWPPTSVLPNTPAVADVETGFTGQLRNAIAAGNWSSGGFGPAFAYAYAPNANSVRVRGNSATVWTGVAPAAQVADLAFILGHLYLIDTGGVNVYDVTQGVSPNLTIANVGTLVNAPERMASGMAGSSGYLAVSSQTPGTAMRVFAIANPVLLNAFTDVAIPANTKVLSMAFSGTKLYYAVSDGAYDIVLVYDVVAGTTSTLAVLPGYNQVEMVAVAGALVIVAGNFTGTNFQNLDVYLLQGSSIQFVTALPPQIIGFGGALSYAPALALSRMAVFGSYALFYVGLSSTVGAVYAYDVVRGAIYRVSDGFLGGGLTQVSPPPVLGLAVISGLTSASVAGVNAPWAILINSFGSGAANASKVQIAPFLPIGTQLPTSSGVIISSILDFTSAFVAKLWRRIVVNHIPLGASSSVRLAPFLDQDPDALGAPSVTAVTNAALNSTETSISIDKMARKLIYEIDYVQTRIISIAVQLSTGWVQTMYLDLGPQSTLNSRALGDYCFQRQGLDHVAAYNFLKQLWRKKGGEVTATFPNGDSGPWLMQDFHTDSPKPFAISFRSDQPSAYQTWGYLKLREDV